MSGKTEAKIRRLAKEIDEEREKAPYGIRPDRLEAYVGDRTWPIKPDAWRLKLEVAKMQDSHMARVKKIIADGEKSGESVFARQVEADMDATRRLLELVLDDFNYKKESATVDTDALSFVAADLFNFLVVSGGSAARPRTRMLQSLDMLNRLISTTELSKNGHASSDPKTGSGR